MTTDELIDIGLHHLARFAFFTRDNPFVSSRAAVRLPPRHRAILVNLLDDKLDFGEWLESTGAQRLLRDIKVGCVPRNVQLVTVDGQAKVGVADVHAFVQAPLFWWLVSILWCLTAGRTLDPYLDDGIKGYRLHPGFIDQPDERGLMFRDHKASHKTWRRYAKAISRDFPGEVLATTTIDLRDFYYSSNAAPSEIVSHFLKSKNKRLARRRGRAHVLNLLLDALHAKYAARCAAIKPRPYLSDESFPLPVGLPSSRILANFIVDLARDDLAALASIEGVAAYADDLLLMSRELPAMSENPAEYLSRLGVTPAEGEPVVKSSQAAPVADLIVSLDKCSTSYSRSSDTGEDDTPDDVEGAAAREDPDLDPYIEGDPDPDWGGRLRTVLQAPHRPERIPRELAKELEQMVDEIRIGLDPLEAETRLKTFIEEIDGGLFLALRPHWVDLLVVGVTAGGTEFVESINAHFVRLVGELEPPSDASHAMQQALNLGLRASWIQAISQALSVALGAEELDELETALPIFFQEEALGKVGTPEVVSYAKRLRERRLIPAVLVSAPLAEFTGWTGPLIGARAFTDFTQWASQMPEHERMQQLLDGIADSVRFVQLHEICIALHLWVTGSGDGRGWLEDAIALLRHQPLVRLDEVDDLAVQAAKSLQPAPRTGTDAESAPELRFALPSLPIDEGQLSVLLEGDEETANVIASRARRHVRSIVGISTRNKADVLVLPEWSLPPQQLPWLMKRAADSSMLVIAGETPTVQEGLYSNRLWTGIPVQDSAGHKECLVAPPWEKRYLSPEEQRLIDEAAVEHAGTAENVPVYDWRGIRFASLVCFEFADIATRTALRKGADLLTVSSLNRDWRYFDAIQESTTRDNYCLTVCVNSGAFPGTKIMRPTASAKSVAASVHGSDDPAVVSRKIDMHPIVAARVAQKRPTDATETPPIDDTELHDYRAFPPV
jgi:predicted amidohydrolase